MIWVVQAGTENSRNIKLQVICFEYIFSSLHKTIQKMYKLSQSQGDFHYFKKYFGNGFACAKIMASIV